MTDLLELRREAFLEGLHAFVHWHPGDPMIVVDIDGKATPLDEVCGLLWNDHKCLAAVDERALLRSHNKVLVTYASAARYLYRRLRLREEVG